MIALVTGANRGIGLEVVKQLASKGHTVILGARDATKGLQAKAKLPHQDRIIVQELDIANLPSIQRVQDFIQSEFGRLDILVNNAGINYDTWQNVLDADLENIRETLETNLFGAWQMIQTFVPLMQSHKFGRIVNVSSGAGAIQGMSSGTPGYAISKAALNILTIKTAAIVNKKHILVNSVCPGWVRTDMGGMAAPRSVAKGAETIVWAATLEKSTATGQFFRDKKVIEF